MAYSAANEKLTRRIAAECFPGDTRSAAVFINMISQESGHFDLDVIEGRRDSLAGARGIAQLMPVHWSEVDPLNPEAALRYAAGYLRDLTARYHDLRAGVAAYNWGPGNIDRAIAQAGAQWETAGGLPQETRTYLAIAFAGVPGTDAAATSDPLFLDPASGRRLPARGPITQEFGPTDEVRDGPATYRGVTYPHFNLGIDVGCPEGTEVRAVTAGSVVWAGPRNHFGQEVLDGTGWGITVWVQQPDGVIHNYGHLSAVAVAKGQVVVRGTLLGRSGNTGNSSGPHLSYDVFRVGAAGLEPIDPAPYLAAGATPAPAAALATAIVTAEHGINFRPAPDENSQPIAVIAKGTRVTLPRAAWYPVVVDGRSGWMWGELIDLAP